MCKGGFGRPSYFGETLQAPSPTLDLIQSGYKLPLQCAPTTYAQDNHHSAVVHTDFVTEAIQELIANHCVKKVSDKPFTYSPLSVVVNSEGKLRLVLNLEHLNQFLHKDKFNMRTFGWLY